MAEQLTPVTCRYILMGLLEYPDRYIPRTPVQQEALVWAEKVMRERMGPAIIREEQIAGIHRLSANKRFRVVHIPHWRDVLTAALRAADLAVRDYKHEQAAGTYKSWYTRKEDDDGQ